VAKSALLDYLSDRAEGLHVVPGAEAYAFTFG